MAPLSALFCQELHKYKENEKDTEVLMLALSAMQDKTQHLENSLSAETRIKLDLFSALGDAKRQLEIAQGDLLFFSPPRQFSQFLLSSFLTPTPMLIFDRIYAQVKFCRRNRRSRSWSKR